MEGKPDSGGIPVLKVLEPLKRHLFDFQTSPSSPSKPLTNREVCSSLADLTNTVSTSTHRPNSLPLISQTVELLVHACASVEHDIRLAAAENLRRLIKALMNTHLSRLQQDLFHELKKNGSWRSLVVSLECFAALFPLTRPSKCAAYAHSLLPVLVRMTGREEEGVLECLGGALSNILPTMVPCLNMAKQQSLMTAVIERLPRATPTYRRMAASTLHTITTHSRHPPTQAQWVISKLLIMGCGSRASSELVQGVLLTLQQLLSSSRELQPPLQVLKQTYAYIVSCLLHREPGTAISAMEALHQMLLAAQPQLSTWLATPLSLAHPPTDFWCEEPEGGGGDTVSVHSQMSLETPLDSYFDSEQELAPSFTGTGKATTGFSQVVASPAHAANEPETTPTAMPPATLLESSCLAVKDGPPEPLTNLIKYLLESVLLESRISAQSIALACVAAGTDLHPPVLPSLDPITPFLGASDPKLRSRTTKLLAVVISSHLRRCHGDFSQCGPLLPDACEQLCSMLSDPTPTVLKAACEALQVCLPALTCSTQPQRAVRLLRLLLPLQRSSYWLTKVELLATLGCLDYTRLALLQPDLPAKVLWGCVFLLLGDGDHRVRTAACEALDSLAARLQLKGNPLLGHAHSEAIKAFSHLHNITIQLSLAGIGDSEPKAVPPSPMSLEHILWALQGSLSSSLDMTLQRGALEALHHLSRIYPPPTLPSVWGCDQTPCTTLTLAQALLTSSRLAWGIQGHLELLELSSTLFLACALVHMQRSARSGEPWCALGQPSLGSHASALLSHCARLLAIFAHILDGRDPDAKENRRLLVPGIPRRPAPDHTSPARASPKASPGKPSPRASLGKPKTPLLESLQRPPLVPRDGIGQFAHVPHLLKVMDACKAAHTNYQVSLAPVGEDRFSQLLQASHNTLAAMLEVALADDVGRHVEELMGYLVITVRADTSGALLCVQQLLNALFGMNMAAQHTHQFSPFISSLPYDIVTPIRITPSHSLLHCTLMQPLSVMTAWLQAPPPSTLLTPDNKQEEEVKRVGRKSLMLKPVNSVSSIKDYIGFFEPLVVHAVKQFPYTSSTLLQQRVLFLIVQLLQLKVRYELLDCSHAFLEAVIKLVSLMESGVVRGSERLVPHLFHFLVLLANDNSKLVTVPEVMQKCDGVMASGHNVTTFAIPALQPLVLILFIRPSRESPDLETQREVVLNMLLRLVAHHRIITLLCYVLECYSHRRQQWQQVSSQIFAALLPHMGRLQVVLENREALLALYQLLTAMDPSTISIQALFTALLKPSTLESVEQLISWLGMLCTSLGVMVTIFPEATTLQQISSLQFTVPSLHSPLAVVLQQPCEDGEGEGERGVAHRLAQFLRGSLYLAVSALAQLEVQRGYKDYRQLPVLATNTLLLWQTLVQGPYPSLGPACASLPPHPHLTQALLSLAPSHPFLTLHYLSLTLHTSTPDITLITTLLQPPHPAPTLTLLHHCTLLLTCDHTHPEVTAHAAATPTLLDHTQSTPIKKLLKVAVEDSVLLQSILQLLMSCDLTSPAHCLQVLQVCRHLPSPHTLPILTQHLIPHSLSTVATAAATVAMEIVTALGTELSAESAAQLIAELEPHSNNCGQLLSQLRQLVGGIANEDSAHLSSDPFAANSIVDATHQLNEAWLVERVGVFCHAPGSNPEECAHVLGCLGESGRGIVESGDFNQALLECCLVRGIQLSMARGSADSPSHLDNSLQMEFTTTGRRLPRLHPLMQELTIPQASIGRLTLGLKADPTDSTLTRPVLWLMVAQQQLTNEIPLEEEMAVAIATLALHSLKNVSSGGDLLALQSAMDCCALALLTPEVCQTISEGWACEAVECLCDIVKRAYESSDQQWAEQGEEKEALEKAQSRLQSILVVLLPSHPPSPQPSPSILQPSIRALTLSLCRVPFLYPCTLLPPALFGAGEGVSDRVLDQALMESEILQQYMQRSNMIGWLNRPQFEERWMQLLGVINQALPPEGTPTEEYNAYILNVSAGVQAVTSLLLGATLRPTPGNPTYCPPMHTHRNSDVLFLGSRPGRKLAWLRQVLELQLLLQCGARSSLLAHYQSLPMHQITSPHFPPLYTRNLERGLGEAGLGVGQMSIKSLWPIMLMSASHKVRPSSPDSGDVDIRSCILSLIDLYSHWLSLPMHTVLLHHMLRSVLMLSDLFALSGQYDWMLGSLLRLYEVHPSEDIATCPLIVLGVLKAAAVLKLVGNEAERVAKVVEKSLAADVPISVQDACLRGLLYLSEDIGSQVLPLVGPTLTKYIPSHLQLCSRFTEAHTMAVWSLAVSLSTQHSHHLRDPSFASRLLDHILPLLPHPHISTRLLHCLTLGLEHLVVNFCLSPSERSRLASAAAARFVKSDQSKSLAALALLLTCMYTGEEADALSGLADMEMVTMETAVQAREQINNMMERLRHGPLMDVAFLIRLLPQLTVDFLSPMEALQTVVSEFVSPHQPRPQLAARVMAETFALLLHQKQEATVTEWVLLSLESFVQQDPEHKAVWSITCLLSAASTSPLLRSLFMLVVHQPELPQQEALSLLCTAAKTFYSKQCIQQQQEPFLEKFQDSHYPLLKQVVHFCLHS